MPNQPAPEPERDQSSSTIRIRIGDFSCGDDAPLMLIAGPCVLENETLAFQIAESLLQSCNNAAIPLVFKASFDKANRTSGKAYRGPGVAKGMEILDKVRDRFQIPVTTDIHEPQQAEIVGKVCDLIQIPAFLARQTDLLLAAAQTQKPVNVKKGQFMAPTDMRNVVQKLRDFECQNLMLTERGTFFGYGQLVNDFRSLVVMRDLGVPVCFDATHSVQQPGGLGNATGGQREMVPPLARAAAAVGIDALFLETHPNPEQSPSDGPNMVPLEKVESLLNSVIAIKNAAKP